jgi:hypothetical protein
LRIGIIFQQFVQEGFLLGIHTGHLILLMFVRSSAKVTL